MNYTTTRENWELRHTVKDSFLSGLYHYERKLGTTTDSYNAPERPSIIPLREKIGNYDKGIMWSSTVAIIPLREKIGNYDSLTLIV